MNHESSTHTGFRNGGGAVIKPWLSGVLNRALLDADKQKTELASTVERLKSELVTLRKVHTEARPSRA